MIIPECQAKGVLLNGTRTIANRKEQMSSVSSSLTMWHCQQNCQLDKECTIFSWRFCQCFQEYESHYYIKMIFFQLVNAGILQSHLWTM